MCHLDMYLNKTKKGNHYEIAEFMIQVKSKSNFTKRKSKSGKKHAIDSAYFLCKFTIT